MLFDSRRVEDLYKQYDSIGDKRILDVIHQESNGLIEVIAKSVCPDMFDDLVQEGHLKLRSILMSGSYKPIRGSIYSFLSSVLRNHMADVVRRENVRSHAGLERCSVQGDVVDEIAMDCGCIIEYGKHRFPSIHRSVIHDVMQYIVSIVCEHSVDGYRGGLRTLCVVYRLDRRLARAAYYGILAVLRMHYLGVDWQVNQADAIELAECRGLESSLLPELALLCGRQKLGVMMTVLGGAYVKF